MSITSSFCTHAFVTNPPRQQGHALGRPWVEVAAHFNGHSHRVWCLVDTGADDTILDLGSAAMLRIDSYRLPQVSVGTAGGLISGFGVQSGVGLDFAGTSVTADVLFGAVAVPLLGRSALLHAKSGVDIGFDITPEWHHS